jgi:hypothetical protein
MTGIGLLSFKIIKGENVDWFELTWQMLSEISSIHKSDFLDSMNCHHILWTARCFLSTWPHDYTTFFINQANRMVSTILDGFEYHRKYNMHK